MIKNVYKIGWILLGILCLQSIGCQRDTLVFEAVPSDGILITPSQKGNFLQEVIMTMSSVPTEVDFGVALYKEATGDVQVELEFDMALVEEYNQQNNTTFAALPLVAADLSTDQVVIKAGEKSAEPLKLILRSGLIEEGVNYLLPLRIKEVRGGNVHFDRSAPTIKYYAVRGQLPNIALGKATSQSSTSGAAVSGRAVDGNRSGDWNDASVTHTLQGLPEQWWQIDLGLVSPRLSEISLYNRTDCCGERLSNYYVFISDVPFQHESVAETLAQSGVTAIFRGPQAGRPTTIPIGRSGRYVRIQLSQGLLPLAIAEVEILGVL